MLEPELAWSGLQQPALVKGLAADSRSTLFLFKTMSSLGYFKNVDPRTGERCTVLVAVNAKPCGGLETFAALRGRPVRRPGGENDLRPNKRAARRRVVIGTTFGAKIAADQPI